MSRIQSISQSDTPSPEPRPRQSLLQKRPGQALFILFVAAAAIAGWLLLNHTVNSTDPTVAGRPLSNLHIHLHTVALGTRPGTLYLGTHYGLFTSTDGGKTWPQPRGVLNNMMITAIAASPVNPNVIAVIAIPVSGVGAQSGVSISQDGGNTWDARSPGGLPATAYPYTVKAGSIEGQFYAFYNYAGWYETRDMGNHWYAITGNPLSNMQTPSLLTDPSNPNHLWLGGDQGLYETRDDGKQWSSIAAIKGNVTTIVASTTAPRSIYCLTDQGIFRWTEGESQITQLSHLPMPSLPSRLVADATGQALYALSGQDIWFSADGGLNWVQRSHFDRGDIIAFIVDPIHPDHLFAGFFMPAAVLSSIDGSQTWQTLTD
jgi:photosystem II stability/assembly factor-like uncharacterized protein